MSNNKLLRIGLVGTLITALCCFTPVLAVTLASVGLASLLGYVDFVLLPALAGFVGLTVFALLRRKTA